MAKLPLKQQPVVPKGKPVQSKPVGGVVVGKGVDPGRSPSVPDWVSSEGGGGSRFSDTLSETISKRSGKGKKKKKKVRINLSDYT